MFEKVTFEYCCAFFPHMIMLNVPKLSRVLERATFYKRLPIVIMQFISDVSADIH